VCVCVVSVPLCVFVPPAHPSIYKTHVSVVSQFTCLVAAQLAALLLLLRTPKTETEPAAVARHFDRVHFGIFMKSWR